MAFAVKDSDNCSIEKIGTRATEDCPLIEPNTKTLVDRYVFAANWCKGKNVLDVACGAGYGSVILRALGASSVTAGDIDEPTIKHAEKLYNTEECEFIGFTTYTDITKDWKNTPIKDWNDIFDVVVSLETFEHVPRETVPQMLKNFKRVCKPGGKIIISTPQRHTPEFIYQGGTHMYEYNLNEFIEELTKEFSDIKIYFAVEFRHPANPEELNTVFTDNPEWADKAVVMLAVITNE